MHPAALTPASSRQPTGTTLLPSTSLLQREEEDFSATVPATPEEWQIKQARKERLYVFWEPDDFGLWTSPNATSLHKPVHRPDSEGDPGLLKDYCRRPRKTRWLWGTALFHAFWPLHVQWTGPFACLHLLPGRIPVHLAENSRFYQLRMEVIDAWQKLEGKLVTLATGLLRRHVTAKYDWTEIRVSTLPYECGYQQFHATGSGAAGAAYVSRSAFISLSCFVSFAIALDLATYPLQPNTAPSWLTYAESTLNLDPGWLSEINESFVCNFTPGFRPGGYIWGTKATYKQTFTAFKAANVPLFICWGLRPPKWMAADDHAWRYRPCALEARWAIERYNDNLKLRPVDDARQSTAYWCDPNLADPGAPVERPPVVEPLPQADDQTYYSPSPYPYHGPAVTLEDSPESPPPDRQEEDLEQEVSAADPQKTGPSIFLARLAKERAGVMEGEERDAAQRRAMAESNAEKTRLDMKSTEPGVGTTMYNWIERGAGVFTQSIVPTQEWKNVWPLYGPDERHYSWDYDEWNLVRNVDALVVDEQQFPDDPHTGADPSCSEPEGESATTAEKQIEELWRRRYSAPHATLPADEDDGEDDYESDDSGRRKRKRNKKGKGKQAAAAPATKRIAPFDNRAQPHLTYSKGPYHHNAPSTVSIRSSVLSFPDTKTILREKYLFLTREPYITDPRMEVPVPENDEAKNNFITSKTNAARRLNVLATNPTDEIFTCLLDLYNYVVVKEEPKVLAPLWDLAPTRRGVIVNHAYFHYHRISQRCHVIGVRAKPLVQQWYLLTVPDPRAVVEVFNTGQVQSIGDIVRYFIRHGIPFNTCKPIRHAPFPADRYSVTLGYRPANYKFTLQDYADYEKKRGELLSGPAGRTALMSGGIVWRLAFDVVKHRRVIDGPTSSAYHSGMHITELDGHILVDDGATPAEEETICGVYRVYTEQGYTQTADKSWFPKGTTWDVSGYNHGYWSADNEVWYQQRLQEIRNGAGPMGANKWRSKLNHLRAHPVNKMRDWINDASDKFLRGDSSYWVE